MEGYCRNFDALDDGFIEVGYFKDSQPNGKYQSFKGNGSPIEEGIKEGDQMTKEIEIANYLTRVLKAGNEGIDKGKVVDYHKKALQV